MKELLKYAFGAILILGLIGVIGYRIFSGNVLTKKNNVADIVKMDNAPTAISLDNKGNTHASKPVINLDKNQRDLYLRKELDSMKSAMNVKDNQIIGLTTLVSKYKYELKYTVDSTTKPGEDKRYIIDQIGPWFSAKGVIPGPDPILISGRDSTTLAFIRKKGKLFADVSSANPAMQYYGVRSFMVPDQTKNGFGVGIRASGVADQNFKYQNMVYSGGAKFMHIGDKWMYDAGAGLVKFSGAKPQPFVSFGFYRKLF